jgi:hypothetical protein
MVRLVDLKPPIFDRASSMDERHEAKPILHAWPHTNGEPDIESANVKQFLRFGYIV